MAYELIVLDLDGTLTNKDKVITPRTKKSLMEAQRLGKKVVLASGRPTYGVLPLAEELQLAEFDGYVLSYNGGTIISCKTKETIFSREIPMEYNQKIIRLAQEHQVGILTYCDNYIIANNGDGTFADQEAFINKLPLIRIDNFEEYVDFPVIKFIMLEEGSYLSMVEPKVKAALGKNFSVYRSEPFFLEIMAKNIDKALSLARLLEHLGLKKEEMIACGDGYNDLSMIKYAGLGVAMENAVLPVRLAADFTTRSNNEDGVAYVVENYMLT